MKTITEHPRTKTGGPATGQAKTAKVEIFSLLPVSRVEDEMFGKLGFTNVGEPRHRAFREAS